MNGYYRRAPGVAGRVVEGEAFLIKMPENVLFVLNDAASRMWVGADGVRSGEDLAAGCGREDARAFLDEMVTRGLLARSASPREKAEAFPQDVTWPEREGDAGPPRIEVAEAVVALGGCDDVDGGCDTPASL